jgi:hypothetical protein
MTHVVVAVGLSVAALCAVSVTPAHAAGHGGGGGGYHGGGYGYHGGHGGYRGWYGYRGSYGGYGWWGPGVALGLGLGAIAAAPYYYPPPYYYPQPPVVYAPPQTSSPASGGGQQSCYAGAYICPMDRPIAAGAGCYCLGNSGQRVSGRAS